MIPNASPLRGVALVLAGVFLLSAMDGMVKAVLDTGLSVFQTLAVRGWMMLPVLIAWGLIGGGRRAWKTTRPGAHALRVLFGVGAPIFFFLAVRTMPLAEATVIFFGATFLMTALSVPVLKEHVGPHRWAAVVVGFLGVVIAVDPGPDLMGSGAPFAVASSLCYALMMLLTRRLGADEGTFRPVFYFHFGLTALATVLAVPDFQPVSGAELWWLAGVGAVALMAHPLLTRGFQIAPLGLVAPFEYSAIVWAIGIGYVGWGDVPGPNTLIGAAIIVASGLYLLHRETLAARREREEAVLGAPMAAPVPPSVGGTTPD